MLYRDLARAVRRESVVAIRYWWGVGANAVRRWRKALAVPYNNEGTMARRVAHGKGKANRPALAAMHARAQDPERREKIGASRRGKPRPPEVIEALRKANIGHPLSAEHRQKMSEVHKQRSILPPWVKPWAEWEDKLRRSLAPAEAARRTGRTLAAVFHRRSRLGDNQMRTYTGATEGQNRLGLRELCQRYVDDQWVADHMTDEQAAETLLDQFKRAVRAELELLVVTSADVDPADLAG